MKNLKSASLKINTIANYFGQFYLISIGLVATPLYLEYLGAEAYGLVGFFTLLQTWFNLLDIGLTPTLGRQVAYARGQQNGFDEFKRLLKSFELIFFGLALVAFSVVFVSKSWLASEWIDAESLNIELISYCISLMGIMVGLRWFVGLYRGGINGLEDQVWLNMASIAIVTLRFVGSLILLIFVTKDIEHFFEYQLALGILELFIYMSRFYKKLPIQKLAVPMVSFHWSSVKSVAPFAIGIAYTAGIWVFVAQVDKLVLSGVLSLAEFGYFSLVVIVAGTINSLSGPISQAVQPRMTYLLSNGKEMEMLNLYRGATQLVTLIAMSVALMVAYYSGPLIYAWTGNVIASKWASDVLFWYSLGNGALAILAFQYYLQVAHGKLKLHLQGSTLSAVIDVPVMIYVTINFGAVGAGVTWLILRVIWILFWTPIVHKKFAPGIHWKWLINDVGIIILVLALWTYVLYLLFDFTYEDSRLTIFISLTAMGISTLFIGTMASSFIRKRIIKLFKEKYAVLKNKQ